MEEALVFLVTALLDLFILCFLLRLLLQWVRADFYNPVSQFIVKVTNPLVVPARRIVPPVGHVDVATLTVLVLLQVAATLLILALRLDGVTPVWYQVLYLAALRLIVLVLQFYFFAILIHALLSWFAQAGYHPVTALLARLVEPVLNPARRILPTIGGLDLSPLIVLLLIQALLIAVPLPAVLR